MSLHGISIHLPAVCTAVVGATTRGEFSVSTG
jgi:hypothetical protein